ncbi:hypothetical protein COT82_02320 [Candidatus Campbellbacteria bacterium CG10_big_fil_rev_8_21_14_0_10_35_52]|uniref:DUF5673 domain-containing protein n=1 Tax=Candidatus Campbellbacteria bacterium CG10_big_fil_rev_8_21_14_0_10_35_52 TaxID=1974527 RepID=A0A2M6WUY3_9BACT|nr:MAG: hypothetical protein COT82_02320 [Candidatus Campbellbacteria bacterium CG10_big_fil_rev_8_21_14_0_10_35_52]
MEQSLLEWSAYEHKHIRKSSDWFWVFGIIAATGIIISIIFNNILFAIVILTGTFALAINIAKKPNAINFKINKRGVIINNKLYLFNSLESFWVEDNQEYGAPKLLIKSKKLLATHIIIPIKQVSPSEVRDYLVKYLDEKEDSEPLSQKIVEFFEF